MSYDFAIKGFEIDNGLKLKYNIDLPLLASETGATCFSGCVTVSDHIIYANCPERVNVALIALSTEPGSIGMV